MRSGGFCSSVLHQSSKHVVSATLDYPEGLVTVGDVNKRIIWLITC